MFYFPILGRISKPVQLCIFTLRFDGGNCSSYSKDLDDGGGGGKETPSVTLTPDVALAREVTVPTQGVIEQQIQRWAPRGLRSVSQGDSEE